MQGHTTDSTLTLTMSSFTIRFEGSISLQEPDATGARSVLIQNLRIYLPEDIERGIVPPNSTAPHVPSESSQPSYKQEAPVEIQEKQEEQIPEKPQIILTPYSVVTDDEDDDQPNFQWSWNHITPTSSSSSIEVPNAPIKSKKSSKKEIDPFDFTSTPSSSSSSTRIPNAPLKTKRPSSTYSSNWIENTKQKILESQQSTQSSSASSSVKPSSPSSSSSDEKYDLQQSFNDHLKQFKMTPESTCENNPQKKQKHFYHFMFWHNFQHNGHHCPDTSKCIINYIYNVIPDHQLNDEEYHHRDRCKTLQKIVESRKIHFNPLCCYYTNYLSFLELNKHQNWRHKLNRYQLMDKYIKEITSD